MSIPNTLPPRDDQVAIISPTSTLRYVTAVTEDGLEWCEMMSDSKGAEAHEDRLEAFDSEIDKKLKEVEKKQKEWEAEYRSKMFRNVLNARMPQGKK
jgi:hypothetical protein